LPWLLHLGHQRAGGIKDGQAACGGFLFHAARYTVGAEDSDGVRRHFRKVLDKDRALILQAFDHVFIVDDLVADIDRGAILLERALDDLDRTYDTRTKSARLRKIHFQWDARYANCTKFIRYLRLARIFAISAPTNPQGLEDKDLEGKDLELRRFVSKTRTARKGGLRNDLP